MAASNRNTPNKLLHPHLVTSTLTNLRMTLELLRRAMAGHDLPVLRSETKQLIRLSNHLDEVLELEAKG